MVVVVAVAVRRVFFFFFSRSGVKEDARVRSIKKGKLFLMFSPPRAREPLSLSK